MNCTMQAKTKGITSFYFTLNHFLEKIMSEENLGNFKKFVELFRRNVQTETII